jgi:hypothetical protein
VARGLVDAFGGIGAENRDDRFEQVRTRAGHSVTRHGNLTALTGEEDGSGLSVEHASSV